MVFVIARPAIVAASILLTVGSLGGCSTGSTSGTKVVAGAINLQFDPSSIFAALESPVINGVKSTRSNLAAVTGTSTFGQLYSRLLSVSSNDPVAIDGVVVVRDARDQLAASSQVFADLGNRYGSLGDYWKAGSVDGASITASELSQAVMSLSHGSASLGLVQENVVEGKKSSVGADSVSDDDSVSQGSSMKTCTTTNSFMSQCVQDTAKTTANPWMANVCGNIAALNTTETCKTIAEKSSSDDSSSKGIESTASADGEKVVAGGSASTPAQGTAATTGNGG